MLPPLRELHAVTYHVADVSTLDEQRACQGLIFLQLPTVPAICAVVNLKLILDVSKLLHVVEVEAHVSCENGADHQISHLAVLKSRGPVPSKNLRVRRTVKGLQY